MRKELTQETKEQLAKQGLNVYKDFVDKVEYVKSSGIPVNQLTDVLGCSHNTIYSLTNFEKNKAVPQAIIYFSIINNLYEYAKKRCKRPKKRKNDLSNANIRVVKGGNYET